MTWYRETTQKLYEILDTSDEGLSRLEVRNRQTRYGLNQLNIKKQPLWQVIAEPFKSIFIVVLLTAALVSLLSHEILDSVIIIVIILINAVIFYTQHYSTTRVLRSLKKKSEQLVSVVRSGIEQKIISTELVPGDIVIISEGERIPADARVVHTDRLQTDESSLTGESIPVNKYASTLDSAKQIYEQDNMVFQGTYVVAGSATILIVETGSNTQFAKIAELAVDDKTKSPVQAKIDDIVKMIIKIVGILSAIVFILALLRGIDTLEATRFVLSLAVSAVPEGLPVALTVILVLGMRRMAKKKALVRNMKSIEDIGLVTTIATDKTGTLTKNKLSVVDQWSIDSSDMKKFALLTLDLDCKQKDPLDIAIAGAVNTGKKHHKVHRLFEFDINARMSGAYLEYDKTLYIKGSPEHIINKSSMSVDDKKHAESVMHKMAAKGYRVIAFCKYKLDAKTPIPDTLLDIPNHKLVFSGLMAFADVLRPEASRAIRAAHDAGISVRLITGDHFETAYNIGREIGLANSPEQVIEGTDLAKDERSLSVAVSQKTIFARILPEDKFRILKALKKDEITAMTGDGVNDVPAIVNAHVGIAMGSGSDIAKDASGIILLDDNFASIVKAIAEGRRIFDNIRRMLFYLISTSLGEIFTMIGALLVGLPLPVTAIQILWINLVTDTAIVLPLGLEPEEEGCMKRPPRRPDEPLLSNVLLVRMFLVALAMTFVTLIVVAYMDSRGYELAQIQTVAFMNLIVAQWMNALNARSDSQSIFAKSKKVNRGLLVGIGIAVLLQMVAMFTPLSVIFGVHLVEPQLIISSSFLTVICVMAVVEIHKLFTRNKYTYLGV